MRIRTFHSMLGLMSVLLATLAVVLGQERAPLYALPAAREPIYASASMAQPRAGRLVVATNFLNDTVSFAQPAQGQLLGELAVGREPRSVAITPDDARAVVVNRGDGTLTVIDVANRAILAQFEVGMLPYSVIAPNNETVFVALQGVGAVAEVRLSDGQILREIPTPPWPAGLTKWGDFLYVTHLWDGALSLIYLPDSRVVETLYAGNGASFTPAFEIDPTTGRGYLLQSRSRAGEVVSYDSTILPLANPIDLARFRILRGERIALDVIDRPVNMPFAAAVDPARQWLYIVNAGSDDLSVIDLNRRVVRAHVAVGVNPRAVLLSRDNAFAYVHNAIEGTLTVIETRNLMVQDVLPISDIRIPVDVLIGAQLFHTSADPRLTTDRWLSCASCHFDGFSDGRVWFGLNTPSLWGLQATTAYTWSGAWDDLHDVEAHIRDISRGAGFIAQADISPAQTWAGESLDLDALVAYLNVISAPPNPYSAASEAAQRGAALFERLSCQSCHSGPSGSDGQSHDVGTGGVYRTPTLRYLWATAPYLHDGSARDLPSVFRLAGAHQLATLSEEELADLVAYLLAWPDAQ